MKPKLKDQLTIGMIIRLFLFCSLRMINTFDWVCNITYIEL